MARRLFQIALTVCLVVVASAPSQAAAGAGDFHRTGQHRARTFTRWALGSSPSPLLAALEGDCGAVVGNAFFIAPPIAENLELRCHVPSGKAIVFSHAAWFTAIPFDGSTDAEIIAAANAGFDPVTSWVKFDGDRVGLAGKTFNAGAFNVRSHPDSFYDVIGAGTGVIRTSITGTFMTLPPQKCGKHVIESAVDFGVPDEVFSGTYHVRIGGSCTDDD
jgi:hypothetical protein